MSSLPRVEAENEAERNDLLRALVAEGGHRFVAQQIDKSHRAYRRTVRDRVDPINDRLEGIKAAIRKAKVNLKKAGTTASPGLLADITRQDEQLDTAYKQLRRAGKKIDRRLNWVVRRSKMERVGLESLHAALLLTLFTLGFGWIEESVCVWVARLIGVNELPKQDCTALWFLATLVLFAAERWFAGPYIDRWLDNRAQTATEKELALYYPERVSLEYYIVIFEHAVSTSYNMLAKYNLL